MEESQPSEFQFEIEQVFLVDRGTAISGLVELGRISPSVAIDIHGLHSKRHGTIEAIVVEGERVEVVEPGQVCTLLIAELTPGHIGPGMLATHRGGERHKELRARAPREHTPATA